MPVYKGKTSSNISLPFNSSAVLLQSINIVSKFADTNFIAIYIRDANGTDISISAAPMRLKQGEAYIRDCNINIDANFQFYITVTGPIDYYIVTTP
jgi:hypothetical protein